jgi:hypothetical protein
MRPKICEKINDFKFLKIFGKIWENTFIDHEICQFHPLCSLYVDYIEDMFESFEISEKYDYIGNLFTSLLLTLRIILKLYWVWFKWFGDLYLIYKIMLDDKIHKAVRKF